MAKITKTNKKLSALAATIEKKAEKFITPKKIAPKTTPKPAAPVKVKKVKRKLVWYETVIASSANAIIQARDFIRFLFRITPKEPESKKTAQMKRKLKEIKTDKAKLEAKKIASEAKEKTFFGLLKEAFYAIGSTVNRALEKASDIGVTEEKVTPTKPTPKPKATVELKKGKGPIKAQPPTPKAPQVKQVPAQPAPAKPAVAKQPATEQAPADDEDEEEPVGDEEIEED
jgi:hypothetical protein